MIKIALCIKQVPDTDDIRWTQNNTIQREGVESVINPYDIYALEMALKLKSVNKDTKITVFTMGPFQAKEMLRKTLALGCDEAVLISDKKFAGSDTYATALTLCTSIKKVVPDFDLVICGQFAVDGDTAQTGPMIANFLDIAQVTYVKDLISFDGQNLEVKREMEDGIENIRVRIPALICVLQNNFEPSRARIGGIIEAYKKEIKILSAEDLGLSADKTGLKGSPTFVCKAFRNEVKHNAVKYKLDTEQSLELLKEKLISSGVISNE